MGYLLAFCAGTLIGMVLVAIVRMGQIDDMIEQSYNAESRALTHFRKLFRIEMIIKEADKDKTPAVFVVDKIKEVITDDQSLNNF